MISIHGIGSKHNWQDDCDGVLSPHFRYEKFEYKDFRHKAVAIAWLALVPCAALMAAVAAWWIWQRPSALAATEWRGLGAAAAVLVAGCWFLSWRRRRALTNSFVEFVDKVAGDGPRPHIIAHSFGTYLLGLMMTVHRVKVGKIILTGCVLSRRFPWQRVAGLFETVRNEVAGQDGVPLLAMALRPFVKYMGSSGLLRFRCQGALDLNDPRDHWKACTFPSCPCGRYSPVQKVRVINARYEELTHDDFHAGCHHSRTFWLPFLWDISPRAYEDFRELCLECNRLEQEENWDELERQAERLGGGCWEWTPGPLLPYFRATLANHPSLTGRVDADAAAKVAIRLLWRTVAKAVDENPKLLYPPAAANYAILALIKEAQKGKPRGKGTFASR